MIKSGREQNAEIIRNHLCTFISGDTVVCTSENPDEADKVTDCLSKCGVTFSVWNSFRDGSVLVELYLSGVRVHNNFIFDVEVYENWPELTASVDCFVL